MLGAQYIAMTYVPRGQIASGSTLIAQRVRFKPVRHKPCWTG